MSETVETTYECERCASEITPDQVIVATSCPYCGSKGVVLARDWTVSEAGTKRHRIEDNRIAGMFGSVET